MGFSLGQRAGDDMDPTMRLRVLARDIAIEFGIGIELHEDATLPLRGYWVLKIGDSHYIHGVNTPAATAFLDGVQMGAREVQRIADIRIAEALQGRS
jgi:hypothetical protein